MSSNYLTVAIFDFQDFVEAIFLGTGPLAGIGTNGGCTRFTQSPTYYRFRTGTTIKVRISTSVPGDQIRAIRDEIERLGSVTHGMQVAVESIDDPNPLPGPNDEVTIAALPQVDIDALCVGTGLAHPGGCTIASRSTETGLLKSVRILIAQQSPTEYYLHDVGHGLLGMCHIHVGDRQSIMSDGTFQYSPLFSDFDRAAIDAVFGAGLPPGATHAEFAARGLVKP